MFSKFQDKLMQILMLFVLLRKIVSYDTGLMMALLVCIPFLVGIPAVLGKLKFGANDRVNQRNAELTKEIAEKVNHMETIKAFGAEEKEAEKGNIRMKNLYTAWIGQTWIGQMTNPMYTIAGVIQTLVIVLVGRHFYMAGAIDLTEWIAFFAFSASVCANLTAYAGYWESFKTTQGAANRVTWIMEEEEECLQQGKNVSDLQGEIRFENVRFSYEKEKTVLKGVSFTVPEGRTTVIVGPSGSGKSTVLNMLERFYHPDSGKITIGGQDISEFKLTSYRKNFTCITQNSVPVSGTIKENLLYGVRRNVFEDELIAACKMAGIYDFILQCPNGMEENISESGKSLSGGQRQKLGLAKLFFIDIPYIILDEATSAMDVKSIDFFLEMLHKEKCGKTILTVAHNRQSLQYADYVIVLADGMVEAAGTLEEVADRSGFFRTLLNGEEA